MRRWRKMTWLFLIANGIFLVLLLIGPQDKTELIITMWIVTFVLLGLAWLVIRRRRSACPVCGGDRRRATMCPNCGTGTFADEVDEAALVITAGQAGDGIRG
jgi:hypothetical protein